MAKMRILSARGDTSVEWDASAAGLAEADGRAAVEEAERLFNELRSRGATAFKVDAGQPAERLDEFDPHAEQIVVIPRVAGG